METANWIAVLILGPGSIAVFIWFVIELGKERAGSRRRSE